MFENNLLCSGNLGYDDVLYHSPAYSDDSGFSGQNFSLESLLDDVLPPVINDVEFGKIKDFSRSDSVSSSNHDHSYSLLQETFEPATVTPISAIPGAKRKVEEFDSNKESTTSKKMKKEPADNFEQISENLNVQSTETDLNIIQCDDHTFSYKNEEGHVIVVDKSRKNAEMARLNRQRKKRYIAKLESEVKDLNKQNSKLSQIKSQQESKIDSLENEVEYLMSVIRNQTMLSSVLKAVSSAPGVHLNILGKSKKLSERLPGKRMMVDKIEDEENSKYSGGVCVHVSDNKVSLEFCSTCNQEQ